MALEFGFSIFQLDGGFTTDLVTQYNSSNVTGTPTLTSYPFGAPQAFSLLFNDSNTYSANTPLKASSSQIKSSRRISKLDNRNNPNSDPTQYPSTTTGTPTPTSYPFGGANKFTQLFNNNNKYLIATPLLSTTSQLESSLIISDLDAGITANFTQYNGYSTATQYPSNTTSSPTTGIYPFSSARQFNHRFAADNTYLDVYPMLDSNSKLFRSLSRSRLDDLDNPNPDPTQFPSENTPNQTTTPGPNSQYVQNFDSSLKYSSTVNRSNLNNSPLGNNSLQVSELDNQNNPNPDPTQYPPNVSGMPTPTQYPFGPTNTYTQQFTENDTYSNLVNRLNVDNSPLAKSGGSLDISKLDDLDNPNPDPTQFPPENTPNQVTIPGPNSQYVQNYASDFKYSSTVNRSNLNNSPLGNNSLQVSELDNQNNPNPDPTIYPSTTTGVPNNRGNVEEYPFGYTKLFTQNYSSEAGERYLDSPPISQGIFGPGSNANPHSTSTPSLEMLERSLIRVKLDNKNNPNPDPTQYPPTTLGATNVRGFFPTSGKPPTLYSQLYNSENTYLSQITN
jgi:hypothetical protein